MLVACSGGPDSLALLSATVFEGHKLGLRVIGVTVDHGLQDGSAAHAERVVAQMAALGADETASARVEVQGGGRGPEAAAREARYAVLDQMVQHFGAIGVLLGHTLDDQAETVLLGLARGSGGRSLAGMRRRFDHYRRPLLDVTRTDTVTACQVEGIEYWNDPHNIDPAYARVRVRRKVLPVLEDELGPGVAGALARTADQLRADMELLDQLAQEAYDELRDAGRARGQGARRPAARDPPPGAPAGRAGGRRDGSELFHVHVLALAQLLVVARRRGRGPAARPRDGVPLLGWGGPSAAVPPDGCARLTAMDAADVESDLVEVLYTEAQIQERLGELAREIEADYEGKDLLIVGILRGAVMVMADLARSFSRHVEMDWMAISSYGSGTKSSGVVRILKDLDTDITGRDVIIVDEIIDTGLTLSWLTSNLGSRDPASVEICTLLRKPEALTMPVDVKYVGWDIPNEFVVGYGLDYRERYRNLRDIGTLAPHVYGG